MTKTILKRRWKFSLNLNTIGLILIGFIALYFGLLQCPSSLHTDPNSEITTLYTLFIQRGEIPSLASSHQGPFLSHLFIVVTMYLFECSAELATALFRVLAVMGYMGAFFLLAHQVVQSFSVKDENETRGVKNYFLLVCACFFIFDWNNNYLLYIDQLKNLLGNLFFLLGLNFWWKNSKGLKDKFISTLFFIMAMMSHHIFIIAIPALLILQKTLPFLKRLNAFKFFLLLPFLSIAPAILLKKLMLVLNPLGLGDKFNYPILTGLWDSVLSRPGVLLALTLYIPAFVLGLKNFKKLKQNNIVFYSFILFCIGLYLSRIGLFGVYFIEPNRWYIQFSPFFALSSAYLLAHYKMESKRPLRSLIPVGYYLMANFVFRNFATGSFSPELNFFKWPFLDFIQKQNPLSLLLFFAFLFYILGLVKQFHPTKGFVLSLVFSLVALSFNFYLLSAIVILLSFLHFARSKQRLYYLTLGLSSLIVFWIMAIREVRPYLKMFRYGVDNGPIAWNNHYYLYKSIFIPTLVTNLIICIALMFFASLKKRKASKLKYSHQINEGLPWIP